MEIVWDRLEETGWRDRTRALPDLPLRQSWAYGAAMEAMGARIGRAVIRHDGTEVAMVQVLLRRGLRVINHGPLWLTDMKTAEKRRVLRTLARHPGVTIATPVEDLSGWGMLPLITARNRAVWRLDQPLEAFRAGLQGKWRNRLVKAEPLVRASVLQAADLEWLIAQEAAQRQDRGYVNLPGALSRYWSGKSLALGWRSGGTLQAGLVFLIHGQSASYFLGWGSAEARAAFAHGPLLWQAALRLRDRGVSRLDLGDVNTEEGASLARFKLGTGAIVERQGTSCLVLPAI